MLAAEIIAGSSVRSLYLYHLERSWNHTHVVNASSHRLMSMPSWVRDAGCLTLGNLWKHLRETRFYSAVGAEETDY